MIYGIQVARGIAALLVVLYHASVYSEAYYQVVFDRFFDFGYMGVDFFFVLSGFIIFYIHRNDDTGFVPWKRYFIKRLIRIYPPYLPIAVVLLVVYFIFPDIVQGDREIGVISSLFLLPSKYFPSLEVAWTLMHEMLFYFFFSLYYIYRKLFIFLSLLWILLICMNIFINSSNYLVDFFLNTHNLEFFFGIILAISVKKTVSLYKGFFLLGIFLIFVFVTTSYLHLNEYIFINEKLEVIYLGLTFSLVLYGIYGIEKIFNIKYPKFLLYLGVSSYSIYLIHHPIISVCNRIASHIYPELIPYPALIYLVIVLVSIVCGGVYYRLYESKVTQSLRSTLVLSA